MMKIKLLRIGKKNSPSFRIVVGPKHRVSEVLGVFNPQESPPLFKIDKERVEYWKNHGAQMNKSVAELISGDYEFKPYVRKEGAESEEDTTDKEAGKPQEQKLKEQKDEDTGEKQKDEKEKEKEGE